MERKPEGAATLAYQPETENRDSEMAEVALAASGDPHAFERLYRRHVSRIHSLASRMLSPGEAEEATQDAFVRAWEKLETFRGESAFGTWLHRLAVNVMLGHRAAHGKRRSRYLEGDEVFATLSSRSAAPELKVDFEGAMAELPDGAKQVFVLHDVEGYRHEEIAELLGVAVGTSKSQLHRARMILRQHLD